MPQAVNGTGYEGGSDPIGLDDKQVREFIQRNRLAIVNFYNPGCRHCQIMAPIYARMAGKFGPALAFGMVDIREWRQAILDFSISGTPTFIGFQEGVRVVTWEGDFPESEFEKKIAKWIK